MTERTGFDSTKADKRRVLIPVDERNHARDMFRWYATHMKRLGDELIFMNVAEPTFPMRLLEISTTLPSTTELTPFLDFAISHGRQLCEELVNYATKKHMEAESCLILDKRPEHVIIRTISEKAIDVIIMGNRGLGRSHQTFLGSVSDYVLKHATIPVIIVPIVQA